MGTRPVRSLADLQATYVDAVNRAVEGSRDDLVAELEQEYAAEQARLLGTVARRPAA